ncbi:hypothetical protein ACB094_11G140700 [Castanea mollissima]
MLPCCCRFAFALAPNHRHRTDQVSNQPPLRHPPTTVSPSNDLSAPATPLLAPLLSISKLHRQPNHFPIDFLRLWLLGWKISRISRLWFIYTRIGPCLTLQQN